MKRKRKNDINVGGSGRWKCKGGRKIEEVVERWNGKVERGWKSVNIKINKC